MSMISIISLAAKKTGLVSTLLIAVCDTETGLTNINNFEDGNGGSYGVCQLSVPAAREFGSHYDSLALQQPKVNALLAAKYLQKKIQKYGSIELGIAAYNSGMPIYNKKGRLINLRYVENVLYRLEQLGYHN